MLKQVMHTACDVRSRFLGLSRRGSSSMASMGKTLGLGEQRNPRSEPDREEERRDYAVARVVELELGWCWC